MYTQNRHIQVSQEFAQHIMHLIYPVPDPDMPFLGIHLTRMSDGTLTVGPNAVLGFKREGYGLLNFSINDSMRMAMYPGFWRLLRQNLKPGLVELKNAWFKHAYLRQVKKYLPRLSIGDLTDYPAGIRAQAVLRDGTLVHDFLFEKTRRAIHVCNAPSPAATSAIPIGQYLCEQIRSHTL